MKEKVNKIALCLLLTIACGMATMATAQGLLLKSEYSYRRYTTQDGLPSLNTTALFQDSKGYLWAGTVNEFARFDGRTFTVFNTNGNGITKFMESENGDIYAIGIRWKWRVRNDSLTRIALLATKEDFHYRSSMSLPPGYGFFNINDSTGLFSIGDTALVKVWSHFLLEKVSDTQKPYWDRINRRFFIPTVDGLYVVGEDGTIKDSFNIKNVSCLVLYRNNIWAVADDGLYVYDEINRKLLRRLEYPFFNKISDDYIAVEDHDNNLLILTSQKLYRYSNNTLETLVADGMDMFEVCVDNEGNIWLSDSNGLYNYFHFNIKNYTFRWKNTLTHSILSDSKNRLWIATHNGILIRLDGEKQEEISYPHDREGYKYFSRSSIVNGDDLYFHSSDIIHFNVGTNKFQRLGMPELNYVYSAVLPDDRIFAGTISPTAYLFDMKEKKTLRKYMMKNLKQMIFCAATDKNGNVLLGGPEGISIFSGDSTVKTIFDKRMNFCRNMFYDSSGKLWLTCENRLVSVKDDSIAVEYTFPATLHNFYITRSGIAIATTTNTLYLSQNSDSLNFIRYDKDNGFDVTDVVETNIAEDSNGYVWVPAFDGIIRFNPENMLKEQYVPRVHIRFVQCSSDNVHWNRVEKNKLKVKHNNNNMKFAYIGLSYTAAENVRYHYRLRGFQNEWSEPVKEREVTFNNLPPGDYVFEIYADAGTDESRSEIRSLAFTIRPAFWQTEWFIAACVVFLMLVGAGVALYIQRRRNRALLEKLRAEKELNELRISSIRLKAIPHFNANVLAAIEYYIANRTKDEAMRLLGIYSEFTFKTLSEVDKAARPLSEELAYVKMYLDLEKIRFLDKFDFSVEVEDDVDKSVQLPNMILHTYCENAVKHGLMPLKSGGRLVIRASQHGQTVHVSVEDNGVGRARAANNPLHSSKQGLSILNRQIEIYNRFNRDKIVQQIDDLSSIGEPSGTRFSVEIPSNFIYIL